MTAYEKRQKQQRKKARDMARCQRLAQTRKRQAARDDLRTRLRLTILGEHDERDTFAQLVDRMPIALLERLVGARELDLVHRLIEARAARHGVDMRTPIEVEIEVPIVVEDGA